MFWNTHVQRAAGGSVHSSSCIQRGALASLQHRVADTWGHLIGCRDLASWGTQNESMNTAETTAAPCP